MELIVHYYDYYQYKS